MKTLLILDKSLGLARSHLVKNLLSAAAAKAGLTFTEHADESELVIILGAKAAADNALNGKQVFVGDVELAVSQPEAFLTKAQAEAATYQATVSAPVQQSAAAKRIVAVTACPTGVAHTFMAAEAIETEAKKRGWWVKVETRGSVGAGNAITPEEIEQADLVIVAADIEVVLSKFAGKKMYRTSTGLALKKTVQELDKAQVEATVYQPSGQSASSASESGQKGGAGPYRHLLTGVSYMLPMVVAGGLCIALSFVFGIEAFKQEGSLADALMKIGGGSAFALMVPVLAGYIAFSIADRPGLTPGLVGGMLAVSTGAGFLGGIIAGFLAGYVARAISNKLILPQSMAALKPILIIPLFATLITGLVMIYIVGTPVAKILTGLTDWLQSMGTANAVILGAILGGMMCTDMGGPVNKVAYVFGTTLLSSQIYAPMAAVMAAGMVPPLAMGLATFLACNKFNATEREGGKAALVLGLCFISEGAIPYAARDPMRVLPCCIVGGALTGALSMAVGAKLMAPHGGLFVLMIPGAITPVIGYLLAIIAGTVVAGVLYALLKRPDEQLAKAA
ncbi:PTS system D-fructose-specific IIB component (F1P-forming) (Frc family) /PTS system D-fructose-specific IIC component (F1P-forming) (Frc family)|uniref:PTS system D-fructose-specific IIB component (F1P-forming) (Frc family) /PTS system D-fructose-specific IIC component (F1P-forming) (Frc family) n=1 Tax=Brenneria salicis ATCC 15712 = DSM 30166 TaxID=714314 RepID=A0A366I1P8_9GAMM|nr:PTS fructose transporter subunit IIBC [Brenneria salicis]NMN91311.1 PTS system D-fructose-specific IIB component (F1P-forming) (Frc family) /PTS system D-fructose-specific IIC component (F1P-forming) (Frc family) [Brenneria salicis ATCC 15712 = DSM 30166]RBP59460.1 PTS system D-fructose-specific IIB component (F1P-forming) (Frc family) /PTS system D-fructose-specific IIC component (F1P-forming) (Frc family) [Brenneria salicis ATCC 15712 = DSM 30166]RLM29730.1 PTS fructose transporter subunit 